MPVPLSVELTLLGWSVVLLIAQLALQGLTMTAELGLDYNASPRDENLRPTGTLAGRSERALRNLLETYPAFVALALALALTGKTGGSAAFGAQLWFWARVAYVPLYLLGIPVVRSLAWIVSVIGLMTMATALLG